MKKTQKESVLEYMRANKTITPMEALGKFGCFRLAAVIWELRNDGYNIETKINDDGKAYAIYTLKEEVA